MLHTCSVFSEFLCHEVGNKTTCYRRNRLSEKDSKFKVTDTLSWETTPLQLFYLPSEGVYIIRKRSAPSRSLYIKGMCAGKQIGNYQLKAISFVKLTENTVDSRYLEIQGTLLNTSRYPFCPLGAISPLFHNILLPVVRFPC